MKITDEQVDGAVSASNGSLAHEEEDLELQNAFENQNGASPSGGRDSGSPIDTIPFNIEGIQTVVKNNSDTPKVYENCVSPQSLLEAELQRYKEENSQLRAALKEASRVNQQWRSYHDQRQNYVQKLLSSLHDLQQTTTVNQENGRSSSLELERLRESFSRQQKEHNEHIQLLQMQVRAHRDDWEAERSEKKVAEIGRIQTETQLQITQSHLEEAKKSIMELEARMKLCKCFAGSNFLSGNNIESLLQPFRHHNGNFLSAEAISRISPSISSTSANSSTSRSSSISRELSANSSPTILKGLQPSPPCTVNLEGNGATSPPIRVPSRASTTKSSESQNPHLSLDEEPQAYSSSCLQNLKQEDLPSKLAGNEQQSSDFGKAKSNIVGKEQNSESSHVTCEPKGARPKVSASKSSDEEERKAKRRARSILASALPMSPSGSKSSSPVTVSSNKGSHIPKGYIPITSTVLTPVRFKIPGTANKMEQNKFQKVSEKKTYNHEISNLSFAKLTESSKACYFNNGIHCTQEEIDQHKNLTQKQHHKTHHSKQAKNEDNEVNEFAYHKNKLSPLPKTKQNHVNGQQKEQTNCKQCSLHINEVSVQNVSNLSPCSFHELNKAHNEPCEVSIRNEKDLSKEQLEIKTAAKMKQNTKSLLVTNNNEKCNTNYASITVMPGPSSALFSHTQTTSTLPGSSSPGISLTTFALNANGQGVPGAIFFALGSDANSSLNSQHQQTLGVSNGEAQDESNNKNLMIAKEPHIEGSNETIVNSTWVQLTENDCNSSRFTQKTPWRTARAVPSHKLNSVRKTHASDNGSTGSNGISPTFTEEIKKNENYYHAYNYGSSALCPCNGNGHKYQQSYESRYQTSFSPTPSFGGVPRISPSISLTLPQPHSQNEYRNKGSPTVCLIPHSTYGQSCAESDLRSIASKNISSAILSYECGSLGCRTVHAKKVIANKTNSPPKIDDKSKELQPKIELNTDSQLICPSCQKLYTTDSSSTYEQHIKVCGGPKYVDM